MRLILILLLTIFANTAFGGHIPINFVEQDDIIYLQNDKTVYLEMVAIQNGRLVVKQVDTTEHPNKTIVVSYRQSPVGGTVLEIRNPFSQLLLVYAKAKFLSGSGYEAINLPAVKDTLKKSWRQDIHGFMLSGFELMGGN